MNEDSSVVSLKSSWGSRSGRDPQNERDAFIHRLIDERLFRIVYQPLVDLCTGSVFAYEALARITLPGVQNIPMIFDDATRLQRVGELGRMLRKQAVKGCDSHPLFLNINPNEFDEGWLVQPDDPVFWHDEGIFMEITESVPITYFEQCHSVLTEVRGKGVQLAVDDLGAGYSNLRYISDLSPEVVKLDRQLVAGLQAGSRLFTLVRHIVAMCHDMGARVVAEGIETAAELDAVLETGADIGQGYFFAYPGLPPPTSEWQPR